MTLKKLIGSWSFYKRTLVIAIPVLVQNLITNLVNMIDNMMVGQIGTEQMSGVAIVNQLMFVFNLAVFGALSGAGIFCAQFFGKKDMDGVRNTFRMKIYGSFFIVSIGILLFLIFGDELINFYLHDAKEGIDIALTFKYAKQYLLIMLIGLVPFAYEQVYSSTLREGKEATVPMVSGIIAVITNVVFNYFLIFGKFGFPQLGVIGAAIATVFSRFVQLAITAIWAHTHKQRVPFTKGLYRSFKVPQELVATVIKKGIIPLVANEMLWACGISTLVHCYSTRGIDVVAGYNIANVVINLFNVMFIAFGAGVGVVIGQLLGANKLNEAKEAAPKLIFFAGAMCVVVGLAMACCCKLFPQMYNTTEHVRDLASCFILISAILMPIHGIMHSSYFAMRAGGKTGLMFAFDCGFSWGILVPFALALTYFTDIEIIPLYFLCQSIEFIKCIISILLVKSDIWISNIVSD